MSSQDHDTTSKGLDPARLRGFVETRWRDSIVPAITDYIRVPNKSPAFDPDWRAHGYMDQVVDMFVAWAREHALPDMTIEVVRLGERTPLIYIEVPGTSDDTVLLYGHLDKQPEMVGWDDDKGPWIPVMVDDRLYGRGGADDGYAMFASLTAIAGLHQQGIPHARCVVLIEACEESGSHDLPAYIDHLSDRIGTPSLVVCLDSGCGNYDQLWCTTSLRGLVLANLKVELISEGVHSGDGTGIIASSFRVLRMLLSRLEDEATGRIVPEALHGDIPDQRAAQARAVAAALGSEVYDKFPLHDGVRPIDDDNAELILNRTWRPALAVTGAAGLPALADAGNVLRPETAVKLSLRLPPNVDADAAVAALREVVTRDPPYGARITLDELEGASGWDAPPVADWLDRAMHAASRQYFGADAMYMGEGGSIPFMGMLGEKFPEAQFLITGVLGPGSNAHGPNEFLDVPCGIKVTCCVASILADHAGR